MAASRGLERAMAARLRLAAGMFSCAVYRKRGTKLASRIAS